MCNEALNEDELIANAQREYLELSLMHYQPVLLSFSQ